jgi:prepilin-type N-terminal cleavage/methylation domain-containing protein
MVCKAGATTSSIGIRPTRPSKDVPGHHAGLLWERGRRTAGFTLVEVCIAVAIMAMVSAVMIPALGGTSRAELRRSAHKVGGTIRQTFNEAALNGRTERMVFNLGGAEDGPPISVESTDDILTFEGDTGALEIAQDPNETDPPLSGPFGEPIPVADGAADSSESAQTVHALLGISKLGAKAARPKFSPVGTVTLRAGIHISDVMVEGMTQPVVKGVVRLVFFANGYTQAAVIHVEDDNKNIYTLQVEALTGRTIMSEGYVEGFL